jgi:hypothetical protein
MRAFPALDGESQRQQQWQPVGRVPEAETAQQRAAPAAASDALPTAAARADASAPVPALPAPRQPSPAAAQRPAEPQPPQPAPEELRLDRVLPHFARPANVPQPSDALLDQGACRALRSRCRDSLQLLASVPDPPSA